MLRKALKLTAASLVISSAITSAYASGHDYKGMDVSASRLPINSVFLGYTFTHHFYRDTWENSYRTLTGSSPENNYSGIDLGMDHMLNDWLALHIKYSQYFRKGGDNDGRLSGLTVGGLGFYNMTPNLYALGMVGATVGVFSHNGDDMVGSANPAFTDADVSLALGAGFQYQLGDSFYLRPMVNLQPYQDRSDTNTSLGFSVDLVYALS